MIVIASKLLSLAPSGDRLESWLDPDPWSVLLSYKPIRTLRSAASRKLQRHHTPGSTETLLISLAAIPDLGTKTSGLSHHDHCLHPMDTLAGIHGQSEPNSRNSFQIQHNHLSKSPSRVTLPPMVHMPTPWTLLLFDLRSLSVT